MQLRIGYELIYSFPQPTPIILVVNIHDSRAADLLVPDRLTTEPSIAINGYRDAFGNRCHRVLWRPRAASDSRPTALSEIAASRTSCVRRRAGLRAGSARRYPCVPAGQPLLRNRFAVQTAWQLFGGTAPGYPRVQAICDYVHNHIAFNYQNARATRSAAEAFNERTGVCRDYAHLAIAFCRCMNIPARYCTGYLGDVGTPPPFPPGDFAAWFEAWIGGRWHIFDPRNNVPRMGRVLMARGRDASDVAIATTFGPNTLESFRVWTDEIPRRSAALMSFLTVRHSTVYRYRSPSAWANIA